MAGNMSSEMETRLPIQTTVARKCSQKMRANAQKGIGGIDYEPVVGVSTGGGGGSVGVSSTVGKGSGVSVAG